MKKFVLQLIIFSLLLSACSNTLSATEAEIIALDAALEEGYTNPRLFVEYDTKTTEKYHYSKAANADVKVWEVSIETDDRPQEDSSWAHVIYYINQKSGDIVHKVSGIQ